MMYHASRLRHTGNFVICPVNEIQLQIEKHFVTIDIASCGNKLL